VIVCCAFNSPLQYTSICNEPPCKVDFGAALEAAL
jgi:hypothetical protein